jgi:hypothetical protein
MLKIFGFILEFIGWLQIAASPTAIGLILGAAVYYNKHDTLGLVIGIFVAILGLILGLVWATRVWIKKGTIQFLSRTSENPELEKVEDK